jgi:uncharacterized protein (DUF3084 family)
MSEFLKKFKSIFVVEEPGTGKPQAEHPAEATSPQRPRQSTPEPPPAAPGAPAGPGAPAVPATGSINDRFVEILLSALEKNNQPGFDYFEFRQSLANLAKMPMDEATRFQSAYAMAQTMGATPDKLVESARFYLGILDQEQSKFTDAHAQQRARLIGNREQEITGLDATMKQKAAQIEQLQREIEEHRQRAEQLRAEINDSTVKIETTKADFEATLSNIVGNIQADVAKIQQHLR